MFGKPDNMRKLTDIVWPCIADLAKAQIAQCTTDIVVVEAAVLFEAGGTEKDIVCIQR